MRKTSRVAAKRTGVRVGGVVRPVGGGDREPQPVACVQAKCLGEVDEIGWRSKEWCSGLTADVQ